jgi:hypothetical protein
MSEALAPSGDAPPAARAGTLRQRRTRQRRRNGLRSIEFDIRRNEVEKLVLRGFLAPDDRDDADAIARALGALLDRVMA